MSFPIPTGKPGASSDFWTSPSGKAQDHISVFFSESRGSLGLALTLRKRSQEQGLQSIAVLPLWRVLVSPLWVHILSYHPFLGAQSKASCLSILCLHSVVPLKGKNVVPPAQGESQVNLSNTTANVNSLPCLS